MNCFFATNHLSSYLEKSLPYAHVKDLEEHLSECDSCKKHLEELKKSLEVLKEMPAVDLNSHIRCAVRHHLLKSKKEKHWFEHFYPITKVFFCITGFTVFFVFVATFIVEIYPDTLGLKKKSPVLIFQQGSLEKSKKKVSLSGRYREVPSGKNPASSQRPLKSVSIRHAQGRISRLPVRSLKKLSPVVKKPKRVLKQVEPVSSGSEHPTAEKPPGEKQESTLASEEAQSGVDRTSIDSEAIAVGPREISLWLKTPAVSKTEKTILKKCKRLRCRTFQGEKEISFQDREEKRMLAVQLRAENLPRLRNHLNKWGRLSGDENLASLIDAPEELVRVTLWVELYKPGQRTTPALKKNLPEVSPADTPAPPEEEKTDTENEDL